MRRISIVLTPYTLLEGALVLTGAISVITAPVFSSADSPAILEGYTLTTVAERGELDLVISQLPEDPVVGQIQFAVVLSSENESAKLDDKQIRVYGQPPEGERLVSPAINTPRFPAIYEALINVNSAGEWTFEVTVDDLQPIFFQIDVAERVRTQDGAFLASLVTWSMIGLYVGVIGYFVYRARRRLRSRKELVL